MKSEAIGPDRYIRVIAEATQIESVTLFASPAIEPCFVIWETNRPDGSQVIGTIGNPSFRSSNIESEKRRKT